jgi:hypothetical protein
VFDLLVFDMYNSEVHELRVKINGKLTNVRARVIRRCDQDGVEGVLLGVLHRDIPIEFMEVWAPIAGNPELDALLQGKE